ncbi:MAG: dienelactone hydrolase family protein [Bacteroidetes bacterium]|nr:dienelactone hydrolase family protein [Bacteroidota bacterium]
MKKALTLFCISAVCGCTTRSTRTLYSAGFRTVRFTDRARIYKPNTGTTDYLHYHPVDADIWYPADVPAGDTALDFKYFLDLFGSRANYYTASKAGDSIPVQFARAFCGGFKCSAPKLLFNYKTSSYKDAKPAQGKFPLIVYLASFNGMGYENYKLLEDLAKRGYVVASIPSIGRYPGDMTMKDEDMMEQVHDALAALTYLHRDQQTDFSNMALLGYSWGGVGDAVLANRLANVKCVISFDGSEFHHYTHNKNEDADFDGIKNSPDFQRMKLTIPYFRLESDPLIKETGKDSVFDFTRKLTGERLILKVDLANHQDFCYLPIVVKASGKCNTGDLYNTVSGLTISYLDEHLKGINDFQPVVDKLVSGKRVHKSRNP